jgi:hypothetical protein
LTRRAFTDFSRGSREIQAALRHRQRVCSTSHKQAKHNSGYRAKLLYYTTEVHHIKRQIRIIAFRKELAKQATIIIYLSTFRTQPLVSVIQPSHYKQTNK